MLFAKRNNVTTNFINIFVFIRENNDFHKTYMKYLENI